MKNIIVTLPKGELSAILDGRQTAIIRKYYPTYWEPTTKVYMINDETFELMGYFTIGALTESSCIDYTLTTYLECLHVSKDALKQYLLKQKRWHIFHVNKVKAFNIIKSARDVFGVRQKLDSFAYTITEVKF